MAGFSFSTPPPVTSGEGDLGSSLFDSLRSMQLQLDRLTALAAGSIPPSSSGATPFHATFTPSITADRPQFHTPLGGTGMISQDATASVAAFATVSAPKKMPGPHALGGPSGQVEPLRLRVHDYPLHLGGQRSDVECVKNESSCSYMRLIQCVCFFGSFCIQCLKALEMGENGETEDSERRFGPNFGKNMEIDPEKSRFPCCVVWTPLPVISWLIPFIGHIGICREDGVILDFAGPNFVCVDDFAFGSVTRYIQINKEKDCSMPLIPSTFKDEHRFDLELEEAPGSSTWDDALRKGTQEFQHYAYSLFTCNCHSFVANNLNRLGFKSGGWNVVNLAALILLKGQWVSTGSLVQSYLPFVIVLSLGLIFGGLTFLTFLAFFTSLLLGWFFVGTYCFKNLIQL